MGTTKYFFLISEKWVSDQLIKSVKHFVAICESDTFKIMQITHNIPKKHCHILNREKETIQMHLLGLLFNSVPLNYKYCRTNMVLSPNTLFHK